MKVANRMTAAPLTIAPDVTVDEALKMMRTNQVRHLPVIQNQKLVGLVTDIELRTAWFPSLLESLTVEDVMVKQPVTVRSDETVFQAARLLHHNKITGLPVLENGYLVGIITQADILGLFLEVMGLLDETRRLDVVLAEFDGALQQVHAIIAENGGQIVSVSQLPAEPGRRIYSFRLRMGDISKISSLLTGAGHRVME